MSDEIILDSPGDLEADRAAGMAESMKQLEQLGNVFEAFTHEDKMNAILGLQAPRNRAERRAAGRTRKGPVLLADIVDWRGGQMNGQTTEGMKPSVRAIKRKSAGKLR